MILALGARGRGFDSRNSPFGAPRNTSQAPRRACKAWDAVSGAPRGTLPPQHLSRLAAGVSAAGWGTGAHTKTSAAPTTGGLRLLLGPGGPKALAMQPVLEGSRSRTGRVSCTRLLALVELRQPVRSVPLLRNGVAARCIARRFLAGLPAADDLDVSKPRRAI